jgi:hypothetical protein
MGRHRAADEPQPDESGRGTARSAANGSAAPHRGPATDQPDRARSADHEPSHRRPDRTPSAGAPAQPVPQTPAQRQPPARSRQRPADRPVDRAADDRPARPIWPSQRNPRAGQAADPAAPSSGQPAAPSPAQASGPLPRSAESMRPAAGAPGFSDRPSRPAGRPPVRDGADWFAAGSDTDSAPVAGPTDTGQFRRATDSGHFPSAGRPTDTGDSGQFRRATESGHFPSASRPADTGQARRTTESGQFRRDPSDSGHFPSTSRPTDTGQFRRTTGPSDSGQFPSAGRPATPEDSGPLRRATDSGHFPGTGRPGPSDSGQFRSAGDSGPFRREPSESGHFPSVTRPTGPSESGHFAGTGRPTDTGRFTTNSAGVTDTGQVRTGQRNRTSDGSDSGRVAAATGTGQFRADPESTGSRNLPVRRAPATVVSTRPPQRRRRRAKWPIGVLVVVLLVVGGFFGWSWVGRTLDRQAAASAAACPEGPTTVTVDAAPAITRAARAAADAYTRTHPVVADHCVRVQVNSVDPAAVFAGLTGTWNTHTLGAQPQAWLPDSSLWTNRLNSQNASAVADIPRSVATSPVVLAMSPDAAKAVQAAGLPQWSALPGLVAAQDGWSSFGQADWGRFILDLPNPDANAPSALALVSMLDPATPQGQPPVTTGLLGASDTRAAMLTLAGGQAGSPSDTSAALRALGAAAGVQTAPFTAVPVTEAQLYQRNLGLDGSPKPLNVLDEVRLSGTGAVADYPYLPLAGNWVTSAQVAAAQAFRAYLLGGPEQQALSRAGFRVATSEVHPSPAPGLDWGAIGQASTPTDAASFDALSTAWSDARAAS